MDIQLEKYKLMEWLVGLKDESLISKLQNIKQILTGDGCSDEVSKLEQTMIQAGLKDIENGNVHSHEQVMKEIKETYGI